MNAPENVPLSIGIRINPTYLVQYPEYDTRSRVRSNLQLKAQIHLKHNTPKGEISAKASKRIRNAVNWLAESAKVQRVYSKIDNRTYKFHINFITLTLPSLDHGITDHQFKNKLLKNWLMRMRYSHKMVNYVWKVETQANGNIHAHLTTDVFIHYSEIRQAWNSVLINNGLMKTFAAIHGHSNPNSTDVKAVKNVKNLGAYLAKYFSKSDQDRRSVSGRLWASSHSLSDKRVCNLITPPNDPENILSDLSQSNIDYMNVLSDPDTMGRQKCLATVYFMDKAAWRSLSHSPIYEVYKNRLESIRNRTDDNTENSILLNSLIHVKINSQPTASEVKQRTQLATFDYIPPANPASESVLYEQKHEQLRLFEIPQCLN